MKTLVPTGGRARRQGRLWPGLGAILAVLSWGVWSGCSSARPGATSPTPTAVGRGGASVSARSAPLVTPAVAATRAYLEKPVATVEGEPLTVREYRWHMACNRPLIVREALAGGEVPDPAHFWSTPMGDQTAWERLRTQTLDFALKFKLEQIVARERGVLTDLGYPAFRQRWLAENRWRDEQFRHGQPRRGPRRFTEEEFYFYSQQELHAKLLPLLAQQELAVTDEEVRDFYEKHRDRLYTRISSGKSPRYRPFDEIEPQVRANLIEEKYRLWLEESLAHTQVVIDDLALDEQRILVEPTARGDRAGPVSDRE